MSAFIVSGEHIQYLINAGLSRAITRGHELSWREAPGGWKMLRNFEDSRADAEKRLNDVGAMLLTENYRSVNARYREDSVAPSYRHTLEPTRTFNPVQVLKAIDCYEYQSCEHDGWETGEAHAFCEALRRAAIHALPGYSDAAWEVRT